MVDTGNGTAVVVLAGGAARRWSGRDKTAVLLAGRTVLEHAVRGLALGAGVALADVVVAAPDAHPARAGLPGVAWVRERPAGGGPVAGLAAAVGVLGPAARLVVVGAGDAPFAGAAVPRLLAALDAPPDGGSTGPGDRPDGAIGVDPQGRDQPLLGVFRVGALRAALPDGDPAGARLRDVVAQLRLARVAVSAREALDLDTPEDLSAALRLVEDAADGSPG